MNKKFAVVFLVITFLSITITGSLFGLQDSDSLKSFVKIQNDSTKPVEAVWNPVTGKPSFVRMNVPDSQIGIDRVSDSSERISMEILSRYGNLFGIQNAEQELSFENFERDDLGFEHYWMEQIYDGVRVYGGEVLVHIDTKQMAITAISSTFIPEIEVDSVIPVIGVNQAIEQAKLALPEGTPFNQPELIILHDFTTSESHLCWQVELENDEATIVNRYFIDAHKGGFLQVQDLLVDARNRLTYDAENKTELPGILRRAENSDSYGNVDIDNAHNFTGETYDYFFNVHGRDSFDNKGAALVSVAHFDENWRNAQWVSSRQLTRYGDGFTVRDVIAHEWTHGIIDQSANLEYRWQSGALNESFADIFGAMVDRDDWLLGEDLPDFALGGRSALRDLSDPSRFGQPVHTNNWVQTCSDSEGVHTNSGITNKAFYNVATNLDKQRAEKIFYRALTLYLSKKSSLEDARAAALQSAQDIYGANSNEYNAVKAGFEAVGIDGKWNPPSNDCSGCAVTNLIAVENSFSDGVRGLRTAATLYRVRDQELGNSIRGQHYQDLYATHTSRISALLASHPELRSQAATLLFDHTPGLEKWMDGNGADEIISSNDVLSLQQFLHNLGKVDRENNGSELARDIDREMAKIDWDHLVGKTYPQAAKYLLHPPNRLFVPQPKVEVR